MPAATAVATLSQECSLDFYLAADESGRICYPSTTPWPLPVNQKHFNSEDIENARMSATIMKELGSGIQKTLRERDLSSTAYLVHNWQWTFDDKPKRKVLTVHTSADWDSAAWLRAAEEIHNLLLSNGVLDTTVELINKTRINHKRIIPECVPEADRKYYGEIKGPIFKIVMHELKTALVYIGLHMYSEASLISQTPCLFIFVKPGSVYDWVRLSTHLTQVFGDRFKLQFRPGRYVPFAGEYGLPAQGEFDPSLRTGASISRVDDPHRGGTSGVFLNLEVNQASPWTPFSLAAGVHKTLATCHHIIAPPRDTADYQEALEYGYPLPSKPDANPLIVCPSQRKLQESINALEADIAADNADLGEVGSSPNQKEIATLKSGIKTLQKELQSRRQLQSRTPIGKVLFSTMQVMNPTHCPNSNPADCALHDHFLLDMALIHLSTRDAPGNKAPWHRESSPTGLSNAKGLAEPVYGMRVFKCGSQSQITSGMLSGQSFFADHTGLGWFQSWTIVGDGDRRFSEGGDLASAVTTKSRELVGQLHGAVVDPAEEPISCMTPMEPIIDYIKARVPNSDLTLSTEIPSLVDSPLGKIQNLVASIGSKLF
ncbi:MAG: hypothetical protein Q9196_001906 [Gyalolechia fulgens]